MKATIYLDTNIFVYAAINNDLLGEKCRKILSDISENKIAAYTSSLTWDEVVYAIWKKEGKEKAIEEGKLFLQLPNISFFNVTAIIISKAQELIENYSIKPRDAIHIATAIVNDINQIASDDPDFDKIKELKRIKI